MPIWMCLVKQEPLTPRFWGYRIYKSVKTTDDRFDEVYDREFLPLMQGGLSVMIFTREPDELPFAEKSTDVSRET